MSETTTGYTHTESTKQLMKRNRQGKNACRYGTFHSEATKQKLSDKLKGRVISQQARDRASDSLKKWKYIEFFTPKGKLYKLEGRLRTFLTEHSLDGGSINKLMKGRIPQHKGWTIHKIDWKQKGGQTRARYN